MCKRKGTQLGIIYFKVWGFVLLKCYLKKGRDSEHKKIFTAKLWIPDIAFMTF